MNDLTMSSGSSTERPAASRDPGVQPWHFYLLLAMAGASWAVVASRHTHPAALLLLSAAIIGAGLVAAAFHHALLGFFGGRGAGASRAIPAYKRDSLEREKMLVLRSIKELEFDHAMRKVGEQDYTYLIGQLRLRAKVLMDEIDRTRPDEREGVPDRGRRVVETSPARDTAPVVVVPVTPGRCAVCDTPHDPDAKFCKQCGAKIS